MIAEATIAAVRDRTDIVALIGESVKLVRRGRSFLGLCPFHKEKTPSFSVNAERGYFYCFGCREHGSAIDFVMKQEGMTFPDAVRSLAERAGIEVEDNATDADRREAAAARRATGDLYDVNAIAATFYEHSLRGGPGAQPHPLARYAVAEMARRGLALPGLDDTSPAAAALSAFRLGYAPAAWDGLATYLQRQGVSLAQAERVGLLVPRKDGSGHYDRFRHRLMFPVLDSSGRVIAFSGRALPEPTADDLLAIGLRASKASDDKPAKYINSPESPIYTKGEHLFGLYQARQAIRQVGEAVLVEGNFDVVSLHARGIGNVVAPLGTAFTEHQARLLGRFAPSVTIAFDGDAAGKKATWASRAPCRAAGLAARAIEVPPGMDPDEMVQRRGAPAMVGLLASAPPLAQRLLDMLLRDGEFEGLVVHDQATRVRSAMQLIAEASDDVERATLRSYGDRIAQSLQVDGLDGLRDMLARPRATAEPAKEERLPFAQEMSRAMLGALLDWPALLARPDVQGRLAAMVGPAALAVLAVRPAAAPEAVVAAVPEQVRDYVAQRLAAPMYETEEQAARWFQHYAKKAAASMPRRAPAEVDT